MGPVLLRTPLLPAAAYRELLGGGSDDDLGRLRSELLELARREPFHSALAIASPDLVAAVESGSRRVVPGSVLSREERSLLRFVARSSTRSTPFGAFAGVAALETGPTTDVTREGDGGLEMSVRPDMGWLLGLLRQLLADPDVAPAVPLTVHPLAVRTHDRLVLSSADVHGSNDVRQVDIAWTVAVEAVLRAVDGRRDARDVVAAVVAREPAFPEEKVHRLVETMRGLNLLTAAWGPCLGDAQVVSTITDAPIDTPAWRAAAEAVRSLAAQMRTITRATASTARRLKEIEAHQRSLTPAHDGPTLQVDSTAPLTARTLGRDVVDEVAEALSVVAHLTRPASDPVLEEYHGRCTEAFGVGAEIPLLELVSEELGVGPPVGYTVPTGGASHQTSTPQRETGQWQRVSTRLVVDALAAGSHVELSDDVVAAAVADRSTAWSPSTIQPFLDVYLQLAAESDAAVDRGEWTAVLNGDGLAPGGRTFGRFLHLLPESLRPELAAAVPPPGWTAGEDVLVAELRYVPTSGRLANVTVVPPLHDHEMVVSTGPAPGVRRLELADVLVVIGHSGLELRLVGDERPLLLVQSHMFNYETAPNPVRLALDVSQAQLGSYPALDLGHLAHFDRLPRISRGRVVLHPARWRSPRAEDVVDGAAAARWRTRAAVPRWVFVVDADNRLLLDLDHPAALDELRAASAAGHFLEEAELVMSRPWLRDEHGRRYLAELVVPVRRVPPVETDGRPRRTYGKGTARASVRSHVPGSAWTSVHLYAPFPRHDDVLLGPVSDSLDLLTEHRLLDEWFYVLYADPFPHVRVRYRAASADAGPETAAHLVRHFAGRSGPVREFSLMPYRPETDRYGGETTFRAAERVFHASSRLALTVIGTPRAGGPAIAREHSTVLAMDTIARGWGMTEPILDLVESPRVPEHARVRFRAARHRLTELLDPWRGGPDDAERDARERWAAPLDQLADRTSDLAALTRRAEARGALTSASRDVVASLLHMQANRLLNADREKEDLCVYLWHLARRAVAQRPVVVT